MSDKEIIIRLYNDYVNRYFESIGFKCHLEYGLVNQRKYDPKDLYTNINITINT